jgi:hypothetical protein
MLYLLMFKVNVKAMHFAQFGVDKFRFAGANALVNAYKANGI